MRKLNGQSVRGRGTDETKSETVRSAADEAAALTRRVAGFLGRGGMMSPFEGVFESERFHSERKGADIGEQGVSRKDERAGRSFVTVAAGEVVRWDARTTAETSPRGASFSTTLAAATIGRSPPRSDGVVVAVNGAAVSADGIIATADADGWIHFADWWAVDVVRSVRVTGGLDGFAPEHAVSVRGDEASESDSFVLSRGIGLRGSDSRATQGINSGRCEGASAGVLVPAGYNAGGRIGGTSGGGGSRVPIGANSVAFGPLGDVLLAAADDGVVRALKRSIPRN